MAKKTQNVYALHWGPTGQRLGTVTASTVKLARSKAPLPYRKYKGEIGVTLIGPAETGGRTNPSTATPAPSHTNAALAGAKILGVTLNKAGKATALTLQLRPGVKAGDVGKVAGAKVRGNPTLKGYKLSPGLRVKGAFGFEPSVKFHWEPIKGGGAGGSFSILDNGHVNHHGYKTPAVVVAAARRKAESWSKGGGGRSNPKFHGVKAPARVRPNQSSVFISATRVKIDRQGYEKGGFYDGKYWGIGAPLYRWQYDNETTGESESGEKRDSGGAASVRAWVRKQFGQKASR